MSVPASERKPSGLSRQFLICFLVGFFILITTSGAWADGIDDDSDGYCEDDICTDGSNPGDCNDDDSDIYPGKFLVPDDVNDGKDNDCSTGGVGDECYDDSGDVDGDGTTSIIDSTDSDCSDANESTTNTDCAAFDADISGIHVLTDNDVSDGKDNNCSGGGIDECFDDDDNDGDGDQNAAGAARYIDDTDGVCAATNDGAAPAGAGALDCDDADADVSGIHILTDDDVADGKDNDCANGEECFADLDGDGFGNSAVFINDNGDNVCDDTGEASVGGDCDDDDPAAANPDQPWYADCDGDFAFQGTPDILNCTMNDALGDDVECAGNDNSNFPYNVSTSAPVEPDCDDFDITAQVLDCEGVCGGGAKDCSLIFEDSFELLVFLGIGCSAESGGVRLFGEQ